MADFTGANAGSRVQSNNTSAEFGNEAMSCENLNHNSSTASRVEHENSACFFNVNDHTSVLQKVKLDVGESERNDASTKEESAVVGNDVVEDKNEIITNGAVENGELHSGNGSVQFQNGDLNLGDEEIGVKNEILEEENGVLDIANSNKEVKDICDAGNKVEESGMKTYEHQAVETEKVENDNSNRRSLEREEDETLADEAEGAELEENMNAKVELEPEQEEKAKSELASENGEVVTFADADKLDHISTDSNSVMNDSSASGEADSPKPVKEEPVKTRSWRDIAVDGMESIPDKVQFKSRNPMVRRSVPKIVKSAVISGDLNSKIESNVFVTKSINEALSDEPVSNINERSIKGSTGEEKLEQVAKQDCKLETEVECNSNNVVADLFSANKGSNFGLKGINVSTVAGIDKEEQVKENKRKKEKEEKARKEKELKKEAEEEKHREEEAKKERLRKEEEAAELRKKLIDEEMEKMRMAEERKKKKKAEKAQKRAEYKAQKEAEEKEKKKAKKQKKKSSMSDTSSVSSEKSATSPEKNSPDASSHDPETSRSAVSKRPAVLTSSKKKKVSVPKDPLPLPLALRNRNKRKWLKGTMWSLSLVSAVLMLFIAGNYVSSESLFQGFTF